jgi:pyruvate dehydrogenase phosphatase
LLVGIFDGHAGNACAQVISKRLLRYLAASLLPHNVLKQEMLNGAKSNSFLKCHNDKHDFVEELRELYETSFKHFTDEIIQTSSNEINNDNSNNKIASNDLTNTLQNAFLRLDKDISDEAMTSGISQTLSVALSGSVAVVAHCLKNHLHVAATGDCQAVLGSINENGQWVAKKLNVEHNAENISEVKRILGEHPSTERDTVIRGDRLLSQLAPLRAFGDVRYKWPREKLQKLIVPHFGDQIVPPHYHTPPYLTAKPDVSYHKLTPKDKFVVLGSDGLWDVLRYVYI